jgi:tetratricopeptide (TPR) repeat protein
MAVAEHPLPSLRARPEYGHVATANRNARATAKAAPASAALALDDARAALARGDWEDARARFDRAIRDAPTAEAWEGLAIATSYLDLADVTLDAREEAFRRYREAHDPRGAVRCAVWLASDVLDFRGDSAVANGWLQRALTLLAEVPSPSAEHAFVLATTIRSPRADSVAKPSH